LLQSGCCARSATALVSFRTFPNLIVQALEMLATSEASLHSVIVAVLLG